MITTFAQIVRHARPAISSRLAAQCPSCSTFGTIESPATIPFHDQFILDRLRGGVHESMYASSGERLLTETGAAGVAAVGSGLGRSTLVLEGSEMTLVGQGPRAVVLLRTSQAACVVECAPRVPGCPGGPGVCRGTGPCADRTGRAPSPRGHPGRTNGPRSPLAGQPRAACPAQRQHEPLADDQQEAPVTRSTMSRLSSWSSWASRVQLAGVGRGDRWSRGEGPVRRTGGPEPGVGPARRE